MLVDSNAVKLSKAAIKKGITTKYRVVLQNYDENATGSQAYEFELIKLNEEAAPIGEAEMPMAVDKVPEYVKALEQVLGTFYNKPLNLGAADEDGIARIILNAHEVVAVAESLVCIPIVTKPIEASLLACGQILWKSIARDPSTWLDFANRIHSRPLFREAIIHAAGKFHTTKVQEFLATCGDLYVKSLLETKGMALVEASRDVQHQIHSYFPTQLQREKTIGRADKDSIGRESYAHDIYSWMAVVCFRQWLCQIVLFDRTHHAEDLGYEFFSAVAQGGEAYMTREDLIEFGERFPTTVKGTTIMEGKLNMLKEGVKKFVQPILANNAELDIKQYTVGHLTCTQINSREYPWEAAKAAKVAEAAAQAQREGDITDE